MRSRRILVAGLTSLAAAAVVAVTVPAGAADTRAPARRAVDVTRQVLPAGDGWASAGTGTTGGAGADADHVYVVDTRAELVEALRPGDGRPRIVVVEGTIDANSDASGAHLDCQDYYPGYSFADYLAAAKAVYDAAGGVKADVVANLKTDPAFQALETKRQEAARKQLATIGFAVPSNTTIIGRSGATLLGASLVLNRVDNVILRNITVKDTVTCFPEYTGSEWVAEAETSDGVAAGFDAVVLAKATHVWIDHATIDGGITEAEPFLLGYQLHRSDGVLDIVQASDLVTISWSVIRNGDKALLWGSTNNAATFGDDKALRITMHHTLVENVVERQPRVRFGEVHVYNNLFVLNPQRYLYAFGVGMGSKLWLEDNVVQAGGTVTAADLLYNWGGTAVHVGATLLNNQRVYPLTEHNAAKDPDLGTDVGWTPTRYGVRHSVHAVRKAVTTGSGAGRLG